jgi:hypothetical protein
MQRDTALVLPGVSWELLLLRRFVFETSPKPQGEQLGRIAPQMPKYARLRQPVLEDVHQPRSAHVFM